MLSGYQVKRAYLDFFKSKQHTEVPSSPVAPLDDPTLLFTSAGMVQFKPYWAGIEPVPFSPPRACSSQKCFRLSDLENVGRTPRHHTFFEMLGNFSFGDYFKEEVIAWTWELCTKQLGLDPKRIYASVYKDDDEAHKLWREMIGLPAEQVVRLGKKDNFWGPAGKTGACGPSSELYWDYGPEYSCGKPGCAPGCDCNRYVEFYNNVFPQFDMQEDGTLAPLKNRGIDTGVGLERLTAVIQGKDNNYATDLFRPIIEATASIFGKDPDDPTVRSSLWAVADHVRALTVALGEGIFPSNTGRGYVLRRLLRRAGRLAFELGIREPFLYRLVDSVNGTLSEGYPDLLTNTERTKATIQREEERFGDTIASGMEIFQKMVERLDGKVISGVDAFRLYDTYGFPIDLTEVMAEERGLKVDMYSFKQEMEQARQTSRASATFYSGDDGPAVSGMETTFRGYDSLTQKGTIIGLFNAENKAVEELNEGDEGAVVLDKTSFYAESGGQVGDIGVLSAEGSSFSVSDTKKVGVAFLHLGKVKRGSLRLGESLTAEVDEAHRKRIMAHHTGTHVLHWALRQVLGSHVTQAGSYVGAGHLRFDINQPKALTKQEIEAVTVLANERILENAVVNCRVLPIEEAKKLGAMALFGEKYGDEVRVVSVGDYSTEFCGGVHVNRAGEIGMLIITGESALAAGVRRLEATCGMASLEHLLLQQKLLSDAAGELKSSPEQLTQRIHSLLDDKKAAEKKIGKLEEQLAGGGGGRDLASEVRVVNGVQFLAVEMPGINPKTLRSTVDKLKEQLGSAVILLATVNEGKVALACGVTDDLTSRFKAGDIIRQTAVLLGGKGGGRPDFAQGGGTEVEKLPEALDLIFSDIATKDIGR